MLLRLHNKHTAMGVIGNAIGSITEQSAPEFRVVAVADHNQVEARIVRHFHQRLGRVATAGLSGYLYCVASGHLRYFFLPLLKVIVRGFFLLFELARQVRMTRQGLTHPQSRELCLVFACHNGGSIKCCFAALRPVITNKDFLKHRFPHFPLGMGTALVLWLVRSA